MDQFTAAAQPDSDPISMEEWEAWNLRDAEHAKVWPLKINGGKIAGGIGLYSGKWSESCEWIPAPLLTLGDLREWVDDKLRYMHCKSVWQGGVVRALTENDRQYFCQCIRDAAVWLEFLAGECFVWRDVVSPTDAETQLWALMAIINNRLKTDTPPASSRDADHRCETLADVLEQQFGSSLQSRLIVRALAQRAGRFVRWDELPDEAFHARNNRKDGAVLKALKRIRNHFNKQGTVEISICEIDRTAKLVKIA